MTQNSNFPPNGGGGGSVAMIVKRATGDIEIRAADADRLWGEMQKHFGYKFNDIEQKHETLFAVTGKLIEAA
jgi:hypothetical protein